MLLTHIQYCFIGLQLFLFCRESQLELQVGRRWFDLKGQESAEDMESKPAPRCLSHFWPVTSPRRGQEKGEFPCSDQLCGASLWTCYKSLELKPPVRNVFMCGCCSEKGVPPIEAPNIPSNLPKWNSLAGYVHFSKGSDGSEWNTNLSLKRHANYWALPPGKHQTCQLQLFFFFFAFLMPLLHCTEQSTLWAVSHDFRLLKWKCFSPFRLTFESTRCRVVYSSFYTVHFKPPVNQVWLASWHLTDCVHMVYKPVVTSFHLWFVVC